MHFFEELLSISLINAAYTCDDKDYNGRYNGNLDQFDKDISYWSQNLGLFTKEQSADDACDDTCKDLCCKT